MQFVTAYMTKDSKSGAYKFTLDITYKNSAGSTYRALWDYKCNVNEDGTITLYDRDQNGTNVRGQENVLRPLADYFCKLEYSSYSTSLDWVDIKKNVTNITPRTFRIDWAENNTPGLSASLGGIYPVDET